MPNTSSSASSVRETVRFSATVYHLDTVKKAAYRFLDRFSPNFRVDGDNIICDLLFPASDSDSEVQDTVAEFRQEVLDQDLRRTVAAETSGLRNAILSIAFAPSKLQDRE